MPSSTPVSAVITEDGLRHRSKARGLLNASNLPALQNLIKRDPGAYAEDFQAQWNHYESLRRLYAGMSGIDMAGMDTQSAPSLTTTHGEGAGGLSKEQEDKFVSLLAFVTQLAPSFPEVTSPLFPQISALLLENHTVISKSVRSACVRSLVLLRNRNIISSEQLLRTLFPLLLASPSTALRSLLQHTITTDLKHANSKSKNHSLNKVVQGLLFGVVEVGMPSREDPDSASNLKRIGYGKKESGNKSGGEALWAVRLAADLWMKGIWNDEKTVSLLALACLHPHPRVQSSAVRFFLGDLHSSEDGNASDASDSEDGGEIPNVDALMHKRKVNKKTRSGNKRVRAAASLAKKRRKALEDKRLDQDGQEGESAAIYLLNDPQGFGDKLFEELRRGDKRLMLEHKVRLMQLLARVMSCHKATVLGFYSYVVKYLMPHQQHITLILVSVAQSVHTETPPSSLLPLVRKLAHEFIHPGVGHEVVAAGINTIREICTRQVWTLGSEGADYDETHDDSDVAKGSGKSLDDGRDLLEDLISYRRSKDKGVAAASRGLLLLYRRENPKLLPRKERGKEGTIKAGEEDYTVQHFGGNTEVTQGIAGLDLLQKHLENDLNSDEEEERDRKAWEDWDADSDDSDASSQGWIDVSSEGEEIDISDDDDDKDAKRKTSKAQVDDMTPLERVQQRRHARRESRRKSRLGLNTSEDKLENEHQQGDEMEASTASMDEQTAQAASEAIAALATQRILTPADFALLHKLRLEAAQKAMESAKAGSRAQQALKREIAQMEAKRQRTHPEEEASIVNETDILGVRKRKMDYEERMAHIEKGREGREFGSKKGKKNKAKPSSTNNADKKKNKPFMMIAKSWSVRDKKNASLADKSRRLKAAKEKQRKQIK